MEILVLNGSPRPRGNTAAMVAAFREGAQAKGHTVTVINVCQKQIAGCLGCEYCHTKGNGACIQKDDMQQVYAALETVEMLVLASPIYFFGMTGQIDCAIHRTYAVGRPKRLQKTMLLISSGDSDVFDAAIYEYRKSFAEYHHIPDAGIITAYGPENKSEELLARVRAAGEAV